VFGKLSSPKISCCVRISGEIHVGKLLNSECGKFVRIGWLPFSEHIFWVSISRFLISSNWLFYFLCLYLKSFSRCKADNPAMETNTYRWTVKLNAKWPPTYSASPIHHELQLCLILAKQHKSSRYFRVRKIVNIHTHWYHVHNKFELLSTH